MYWEDHYIQLSYRDYDFYGRKINLSYRVALTTTPCRYGGLNALRFWFVCPLVRNGISCKRRVGVLYKPPYSDYFGCRKCFNLTYQSSKLSGRHKKFGKYLSIPEVAALDESIRKRFHKGNFTKRYKRFLKKREQAFSAREVNIQGLKNFIAKHKRKGVVS